MPVINAGMGIKNLRRAGVEKKSKHADAHPVGPGNRSRKTIVAEGSEVLQRPRFPGRDGPVAP